MNNQHVGLSQVLAEQRITERRQQAAHAQLVRGARPPRRRHRRWAARGWWQLARWPAVATDQPVACTAPVDRSEATMSKHARALILGTALAAMNLAALTTVAQAQANNEAKDARPPSERQVGETWRKHQATPQQQTAADAALRRQLARERSSIPSGTPAQLTAPAPAESSGQPGWLVASLGVLAALALAGGLAVLAAKRAGRRARIRHAA
jgi:hypothetical protein